MGEVELIAAARAGDEDAFRVLYEQHAAYVRAIGRSILRTKDLDDMCQETFMRAFTRLDSFAGDSQFRTWLTRIAINLCLLTLRKAQQPTNGDAQLMQIDADMAEDDMLDRCVFASRDRMLESVPTRLYLERLLTRLRPEQRRVVEMAYLEDVPDLAIAERLGTTVSTIKCRLQRARKQLRNMHRDS